MCSCHPLRITHDADGSRDEIWLPKIIVDGVVSPRIISKPHNTMHHLDMKFRNELPDSRLGHLAKSNVDVATAVGDTAIPANPYELKS